MLDLDQRTVTIENTRVVVKGYATDSDGKAADRLPRRVTHSTPRWVALLTQRLSGLPL
jgi:hypothetical protein